MIVVTRLFPAANARALGVNGLGFLPGNSNVDRLFAMLGGASAFNSANLLNVYGEKGFEVAAQDAYLKQVGGYQGIFIESATLPLSVALGHSAAQMTDSLAIYHLIATLDPTLNASPMTGIQKITSILNAASTTTNGLLSKDATLETTLDSLRTLFQRNYANNTATTNLGFGNGTLVNNSEDYYTKLLALETYLKTTPFYNSATQSLGLTVNNLTASPGSLAGDAQPDLTTR